MRHRFLTSVGMLAVVMVVMSLLLAIKVAAQAPTKTTTGGAKTAVATTPAPPKPAEPAKGGWTPPRTAWGDPDLQGIYNYATSTPLQRPRNVGDKEVLSDDEAADLQEELAHALDRDRRDGGAEADANRAYNEHWMDPLRMKLTADKRTSLVVDPPDGRIPPRVRQNLTPEQEKARAESDVATRRFNTGFMESYRDGDVGNRCIIRRRNEGGGHPYLPAIYNNMAQIFQTPGYVVIYAEMIHFSRIIPVDGRPHLGQRIKTWLGDPRGHWEGNALVVETTNFRSNDGMGNPIGRTGVVYGEANPETFQIVERFTRVDANTINYDVTMSDPTTWTRPFTIRVPWNKTQDQIYEYACQETNYDMYHWLSGARAREKAGEVFDPHAPGARGDQNER